MSNDNWQNDWCVIFPKEISGLSCLNYEKIHGSVFLCKHLHHRLKSWLQCNTDSFLRLLPHRLIYMADPIMSAGRDSFYTTLESIIDSVGCVLFDSKIFLLRRRRGGAIRGFGRGYGHSEEEISIEQVRVCWIWRFWRWRRSYDWNKHESGEGRRWSCRGSQKEMERHLG